MTGEHRGEQHAGDLVVAQGRAVFVGRLHQGLQEVLAGAAGALALGDDAADQLDQAHARGVAGAERRQRQVLAQVAERRDAAESRRRYADDLDPEAIDQNVAADSRVGRAERASREAVAEHGDEGAVRQPIFFGGEKAAGGRPDAERLEIARQHVHDIHRPLAA